MAAYPQLEVSGNTAGLGSTFNFTVVWFDEGGAIAADDIANALASLLNAKYPGTTPGTRRLTVLNTTNV